MNFLAELLAATLRNATPLVYGTIGETYSERAGVLNLGIEGTMYAGAFFGFAAAATTGSRSAGLLAAVAVGLAAGALMGLLTVTIGTNQHVAGIGTTLGLIGISEYVNRLVFRQRRRTAEDRALSPLGTIRTEQCLQSIRAEDICRAMHGLSAAKHQPVDGNSEIQFQMALPYPLDSSSCSSHGDHPERRAREAISAVAPGEP